MKTIARRIHRPRNAFILKHDGFQFSLPERRNFSMILDGAQNANDRLSLVVSNLCYFEKN